MLKQYEVQHYQNNGYVVPSAFRLTSKETDALRADLEDVLRLNREIPTDRLINIHVDGKAPYGAIGAAGFQRLANDPRILDMVEQVIGGDLILWLTHLFCKPATTGREVPWHQDGEYWPIEPAATCTVWVALDTVDKENGAMRVIPGSHKDGSYPHAIDLSPNLTLNQVADRAAFNEESARYIELAPGQVSLHDVGILHGSAPNRSNRRRAGLALRYMPATAYFRRDRAIQNSKLDWATLPLQLVRGVNRNKANDLTVGHADFDPSNTSAKF